MYIKNTGNTTTASALLSACFYMSNTMPTISQASSSQLTVLRRRNHSFGHSPFGQDFALAQYLSLTKANILPPSQHTPLDLPHSALS